MTPAFPLVGRQEELELLLETVNRPDGRGAVVAGALGVGKTRLVREAVEVLGSSFSVEWTAATPGSASVPFLAFAHLLPDFDAGSSDDRGRLFRSVTDVLAARADGAPVVLVVDDAQWLDTGSAALVHQLVVSGSVRVVLTVRTGEVAADPIVGLWKDGLIERLELQPLTPLDHDDLVRAALDRPVDRSSLGRLWALSKGNPLFVREVLLGALETSSFTERDGVWTWAGAFDPSTRLSVILEDRLGRVSEAARTVLDHLAVGEPLPLDTLRTVAGDGAIAEAERAGLAVVEPGATSDVRLWHPLYAEALRAAMSTVERRQVMARLADGFDVSGASRAQLLRIATWRLESVSPAPEGLFTDAAEIANAVYDHELAERLARQAVAHDHSVRAALALGEALNRQGRCPEGLAVLEPLTALAGSDAEHVAVAAARYFGLTAEYGFRPEYETLLLDAERQVEDPAGRAFLRSQRATLLCFTGQLAEGVALASEADGEDVISQLRAVPALGGAWLCEGKADSACALGDRMLGPALEHRDEVPQAPAWVLSTQLPALVAAGRLDDAEAAVAFVEAATAAQGGSAEGPSFLALTRGMAALQRGLARTAYEELRESVAGLRTIARWRLPFALVHLVEACALVGDADGAIAAGEEADELVAHAAIFEGMARRSRGWAALARGQRAHAIELFSDAAEWSGAHGQHSAELFALHDALRLGAGRSIASRLEEVAAASEGKWAPLFSAHAVAHLADDGPALESVCDGLEELGALLLAAEAASEAAASFRRAGLRARVQRCETRARVLASRCEGARSPVLEELDAPVQLTSRESEIVHLAATGMAASAIAERLFVSTRTVEGHLHRAYAKLGVSDRRSLARLLGSTSRESP